MNSRSLYILASIPLWLSVTAFSQQTKPSSRPTEMTAKELFSKESPAVVRVVAGDASGSGFFVSSKGLVITNYHVIEGAKSISVLLPNNAKFEVKKILVQDKKSDLALLETGADDVPFLRLTTKDPEAGDKVYAIGNPRGLKNTITDGIVSSIREEGGVRYVQTTAPISPGSSGGPLLIPTGEVVGVTTFTYLRSQNLNFAVLWPHIEAVIKNSKTDRPTTSSNPSSEELGVEIIMNSLPKEFLPEPKGAWDDLKMDLGSKWLSDKYGGKRIRVISLYSPSSTFHEEESVHHYANYQMKLNGKQCRIICMCDVSTDSYQALAGLHKGDTVAFEGEILEKHGVEIHDYVSDERGTIVNFTLFNCTVTKTKPESVTKPSSRPTVPVQPLSDEEKAKSRLKLAEAYIGAGKTDKAKELLRKIITDYTRTTSAKAAKTRLKELEDNDKLSK